jgi:uncharacterized membrane protein
VVKEAMAMRDGHLLQRVGREFVKNAIWMVVVFGALGAILVAATDLPLVGVAVFVGAFVAMLAVIMDRGSILERRPRGYFPRWRA